MTGSNGGEVNLKLLTCLSPLITCRAYPYQLMAPKRRMDRAYLLKAATASAVRQARKAAVTSALQRRAEQHHEEQAAAAEAAVAAAATTTPRTRLIRVGRAAAPRSMQQGSNAPMTPPPQQRHSPRTRRAPVTHYDGSNYAEPASSEASEPVTHFQQQTEPNPSPLPPTPPLLSGSTLQRRRLPDRQLYVPPPLMLRQITLAQQGHQLYAVPLYVMPQPLLHWNAQFLLQHRPQQPTPPPPPAIIILCGSPITATQDDSVLGCAIVDNNCMLQQQPQHAQHQLQHSFFEDRRPPNTPPQGAAILDWDMNANNSTLALLSTTLPGGYVGQIHRVEP